MDNCEALFDLQNCNFNSLFSRNDFKNCEFRTFNHHHHDEINYDLLTPTQITNLYDDYGELRHETLHEIHEFQLHGNYEGGDMGGHHDDFGDQKKNHAGHLHDHDEESYGGHGQNLGHTNRQHNHFIKDNIIIIKADKQVLQNEIRRLNSRFLEGLAYGIGFSIVLVLILYYLHHRQRQKYLKQMQELGKIHVNIGCQTPRSYKSCEDSISLLEQLNDKVISLKNSLKFNKSTGSKGSVDLLKYFGFEKIEN